MADDLKASLTKVLQNKGKKRFFFAYGTGKRTDGKGDGHLLVATKKPKKAEVQAECPCSSYAEGYCWSSLDGGTVFFGGKPKLAAPMVAKMALTAKKISGKQYDFQVPTPEEEARAEKLSDSDEAVQPQSPQGTATSPLQPGPSTTAPSPEFVSEKPTTEPASDDPLAEWKTYLALWTPAIKTALAAKGPNAAAIAKLYAEATALAKAGGDLEQALDKLSEAHRLATAVQGGGSKVNFAKYRLDWETAKKTVGGQLQSLGKLALAEFPEFATAVKKLDDIVGHFNEGLGDALDDVYTAADAEKRTVSVTKALGITTSYLNFVQGSKLIDHVEEHPFEIAPITVRSVLLPPLQQIQKQLQA